MPWLCLSKSWPPQLWHHFCWVDMFIERRYLVMLSNIILFLYSRFRTFFGWGSSSWEWCKNSLFLTPKSQNKLQSRFFLNIRIKKATGFQTCLTVTTGRNTFDSGVQYMCFSLYMYIYIPKASFIKQYIPLDRDALWHRALPFIKRKMLIMTQIVKHCERGTQFQLFPHSD